MQTSKTAAQRIRFLLNQILCGVPLCTFVPSVVDLGSSHRGGFQFRYFLDRFAAHFFQLGVPLGHQHVDRRHHE